MQATVCMCCNVRILILSHPRITLVVNDKHSVHTRKMFAQAQDGYQFLKTKFALRYIRLFGEGEREKE